MCDSTLLPLHFPERAVSCQDDYPGQVPKHMAHEKMSPAWGKRTTDANLERLSHAQSHGTKQPSGGGCFSII